MQTTWVLPLRIEKGHFRWKFGEISEWEKYAVVTVSGSVVGPRLLKGMVVPLIKDWGPFDTEEDASKLKAKLETHINSWPKKRRRK